MLQNSSKFSNSDLYLDEESHTYYLNDVEIPGVTSVLEEQGLTKFHLIPQDRLVFAGWRGTQAHRGAMFYDLGMLDMDRVAELNQIMLDKTGLDAYLPGLVNAWIKFIHDTGFECELIEETFCSYKWKYGLTLDRTGTYKGRKVLLDIKTGVLSKTYAIQCAAYKLAYNERRVEIPGLKDIKDRMIVLLKPDGTYRVECSWDKKSKIFNQFPFPDHQMWYSALTMHYAKVYDKLKRRYKSV